jgi:hypothetical protein
VLEVLGLFGVTYTCANALPMREQDDERVISAIVSDIFELEPSGGGMRPRRTPGGSG